MDMENLTHLIREILKDIQPLLQQAGKDIVLVEATEDRARFRLEGFCSGCGCGDSYREGIREMVSAKMPGVKVEFE
jgi:Fe-S cluster biogenesis protein NfuA